MRFKDCQTGDQTSRSSLKVLIPTKYNTEKIHENSSKDLVFKRLIDFAEVKNITKS